MVYLELFNGRKTLDEQMGDWGTEKRPILGYGNDSRRNGPFDLNRRQKVLVNSGIVSERMRRDALRLRRAVLRIQVGFLPFAVLRHFYIRTPLQIQEAAAAYYLMRQRLLALYGSSHSGRLPALAAVL
jgi:hypothetical protein